MDHKLFSHHHNLMKLLAARFLLNRAIMDDLRKGFKEPNLPTAEELEKHYSGPIWEAAQARIGSLHVDELEMMQDLGILEIHNLS